MELSALRIDVTIADLELVRLPSWWILSHRGSPLGRAGLTLPDPDGELYRTIKTGDAITFEFGYRDLPGATWSGTVALVRQGDTRDQIEVAAVDAALPLNTVKIIQAWENDTPEAIVAWAIRAAGLAPGRLARTGLTLPRFVASNITAWQIVHQVMESCRKAFGLDLSAWAFWLGADGLVHWGDYDELGDVPLLSSEGSLIDHQPGEGARDLSLIESWLLPDLTHSRLVRLQDERRELDITLRAQRVRHQGTPDRVRTFIWY